MRVLELPHERAIGGAEAQAEAIARHAERVVREAEQLIREAFNGTLCRKPPARRPGPHRRPAPQR